MQITLGQLRQIFREEAVNEASKVSAHPSYMQKERVREHMQEHIVEMIKSGEIRDQAGVDEWCNSADMSLKALKMIPFDVWRKMAK